MYYIRIYVYVLYIYSICVCNTCIYMYNNLYRLLYITSGMIIYKYIGI